ncbi:LLM class flavin-dependent oxidoreductase, partial [Acinetobacter sp. FNA3]|nr:LLM class flavin-dependent oxidoreductase [Acinetobacter pollinis]
GTPLEIANQLEEWFEENAADGFIIQGATPNTLTQFIQQVIPILQKKGLYRTEYLGTTLRENLQLSRPNNQFQTIQQKEKIA